MRKKIYLLILTVLSLTEIYFVYAVIGSFIKGAQAPLLYGENITFFTGMYIMAICFFAGALIVGALIAVFAVRLRKQLKKAFN